MLNLMKDSIATTLGVSLVARDDFEETFATGARSLFGRLRQK